MVMQRRLWSRMLRGIWKPNPEALGKQDQNCQEQFRARLWCEERGPEFSSWPSVAECFTARPSSCGCACWCSARNGQPLPDLPVWPPRGRFAGATSATSTVVAQGTLAMGPPALVPPKSMRFWLVALLCSSCPPLSLCLKQGFSQQPSNSLAMDRGGHRRNPQLQGRHRGPHADRSSQKQALFEKHLLALLRDCSHGFRFWQLASADLAFGGEVLPVLLK